MKRIFILVFFVSLNVSATDLLELHKRAVKHNTDLIHNKLNLSIANEDLIQKRSSVYPEINFTAKASETTIERYKSSGSYEPSNYDSDTYNLTIRQPIFHLYVFDEIKKSKNTLKKNQIQERDSESLVILESVRHYFNLIKYKNLVELNKIKNSFYNSKYTSSAKLLNSGSISIQEFEQYKNDFDQSLIDIDISKNQLSKIKNQVYIFSGKELNDINDIRLVDLNHKTFNIENLINSAYLRNNSIKLAKQNIKINRNIIASQKSKHYPTLDITAEYGYLDITQGGSQFGATTREDSTISLVFNFPIYNGGYQTSKTREAKLNYEKARYDYKNTKRELRKDVIETFNNYNTGMNQYNTSLQIQNTKQRKYEKAQLGNEKGIYTDTELLEAKVEYFQSKFNTKNIFMDYLYNKLMLDYLSNNLDVSSLRKINTYLVW